MPRPTTTRKKTAVYLDAWQKEALDAIADEQKILQSAAIRWALDDWLPKRGKKKPKEVGA